MSQKIVNIHPEGDVMLICCAEWENKYIAREPHLKRLSAD
jgi:hypothetical protein